MNYSTNQNRHLFIVNAFKTSLQSLTNVGDLQLKTINNGCDKEIYFLYKGPETVIKSPKIQVKNLTYAKAVENTDMQEALKKVEVTLNEDVNDGAPVVGEDYVLRIAFRQFYGMSDQDQYFKDAVVHVTSAMTTAKDFFDAMVTALNLAFSRELGASKTSNPYLSFEAVAAVEADALNEIEAAPAKLVITEKAQTDYVPGIASRERVYFDVVPTYIYADNDDVVWGTAVKSDSSTKIGNGPKIADLEWFCMGERGDQYRMKGWPNYIPTKYLADASTEYHVFEIHHAFTDTGVNSYRSEKDITIAVPIGTSNAGKTTINSIIGAFNSAAGTSIATL